MARTHVGDASWTRVSVLTSIHVCLRLVAKFEGVKGVGHPDQITTK
jgi:hypothetical protein